MAISNAEMKPNRFGQWAAARKRVAWIQSQLAAGRTVYLTTYTRSTTYTAKHSDWFKADRSGAYVRRGKSWDCIDYCGLTAR